MRRPVTNVQQFEQAVAADIARWGMLPDGAQVGVAVSGGADSVCLLRVLSALRAAHNWQLLVLHLNHGLRGADSDADEEFVRELAAKMGLPVEVRRAEPRIHALTGVEEWAREQRLAFFHELLRNQIVSRIATGHHRGDQAETVLFRLLRGAGSRGLGGMRPVTAHGIARPLLDHSRDSIRQYLEWRNQRWREDATNRDQSFARNSLRNRWIPTLSEAWNPGLEGVLAATAEQLRDESAFLEDEAQRAMDAIFRLGSYGWEAKVAEFGKLPVALQRRVVLLVAEQASGAERGGAKDGGETAAGLPTFDAVETVRTLWSGTAGHGRYQTRNVLCERSGEWVRMVAARSAHSCRADSGDALRGGVRIRPGESGRFAAGASGRAVDLVYFAGSPTDSLFVVDGNSSYTESWSLLQSDRLRFPLILRPWREGDAIQRAGRTSKRKLKLLFQRYGVPVWRRQDELVLESGGDIVWASSFGVASSVVPAQVNASCLAIRFCHTDKEWESGRGNSTS